MRPEQVKAIPYFRDLDSGLLERVRTAMFELRAAKGQLLFSEGEPAEAMYGVASGQVKIFKLSPDGREQILRIVGPDECFNVTSRVAKLLLELAEDDGSGGGLRLPDQFTQQEMANVVGTAREMIGRAFKTMEVVTTEYADFDLGSWGAALLRSLSLSLSPAL
jgi:CRP-like cAMP-binding protein